jgi:hypothetical protein
MWGLGSYCQNIELVIQHALPLPNTLDGGMTPSALELLRIQVTRSNKDNSTSVVCCAWYLRSQSPNL